MIPLCYITGRGQVAGQRSRQSKIAPSYGWVIVGVSFVIITITYGMHYSFGVFFKPLQENFGWTRAVTSGVFSLYMFLHCALAILAGWALERYGSRTIVASGGCLIALGLLLSSQTNVAWQIYISYGVVFALGASAIYTPLITTASQWFTERKGLALGIMVAGVGMGAVIIPPLARWLISLYSWRTSYLILGLIAGIVIVASSLLLRRGLQRTNVLPHDTAETPNDASVPLELEGLSLREAARTASMWVLFSMSALQSVCVQMVMIHLVTYATDNGIPPLTAATLISIIGGFSILGKITVGSASDRIGRKIAFIICALFMAGVVFWLTMVTELWMFYLSAAIFGFSYGGQVPLFPALTGELFGLRHMGIIFGVIMLAAGVGGSIGPLLAGYVFDSTGSYSIAFSIAGIGMLVAAALAFRLKAPSTVFQGG